MAYSKKDFWLSILTGEITAWLSLPVLKNLKILSFLAGKGISLSVFIAAWAILAPLGAALLLYFFYLAAKIKNRIGLFQMGKYGVIGLLNTFLNAGIYNGLIFLTNIAAGFSVDLFFAVAFIITVVNSFFWNKYWAFGEKGAERTAGEAVQFFAVSAVVAIVNIAILHIIINVIGAPSGIDPKIWANVGLAITIVVAFFGNFFGYKFLVFKK